MESNWRRVEGELRRIAARSENSLVHASRDEQITFLNDQGVEEEKVDTVLAGLEAIRDGRRLNMAQAVQVKAIIMPRERPAIDIVDGSFGSLPDPWTHLEFNRTQIEAAIPSVGRLEADLSWPPYPGTTFVVGSQLLMTNRHVAELVVKGLGQGSPLFMTTTATSCDFLQEVGKTKKQLVEVKGARMVHPYWDIAILELKKSLPKEIKPIRFLASPPAALSDVTILGYPLLQDSLDPNYKEEQQRIFGGISGKKRMQPGKLTGTQGVESFSRQVQSLTHDASTLGGNSGSVVLDVATGNAAGIHFKGFYHVTNHAVSAYDLYREPRLRDLGLLFDADGGTPPASDPKVEEAWKKKK